MEEGKEKGYVPFDWYDFIWETNPQYYLNANISGGSDKTNYYVSVGHMSQDAMIVNYGGFKRTNVQMNIDTQITSRLKWELHEWPYRRKEKSGCSGGR